MPARTPETKANPRKTGSSHNCSQGIVNDLDASVLKYGNNSHASNRPITNEIPLYNIDSVKNCLTKPPRCEPTTLRNPTSLALLADFAVVRFTKLIQAIRRINAATPPNSHTKRMSPWERLSRISYECRLISVMG